jgi:fatty-acyl-CoA synthase
LPDVIVLVPPRTIPKTSSGKLQRSACKQAYLDNKLAHQPLPVKLQFLKLMLMSFAKKCYRGLGKLINLFYAAYIALIALVTIPPLWLLVAMLPKKYALKATRFWARNLFRVAGCPVSVQGLEHSRFAVSYFAGKCRVCCKTRSDAGKHHAHVY